MPMLRTIDRPTKATLRPCWWAASRTCWMRCTWLAKLETMTRRGAVRRTCSIAGFSSRSEVVKPGTSALVESVRNRSTPSSPRRAKARRSVMRSSSGNWSILKSPVCSTRPARVRRATARPSGMEWLTATNSQSKGPKPRRSPSRTRTVRGRMPCSLSLASRKARVSFEPTTGMSDRSRSRYGTPPMWSSWPWVSTTATMSSRRSRIEVKSGRITSTPGWFSSGNSTPQSTISSLPACSKTVMFRPISPRPPRAVTLSPPSGSGGAALSSGCGWLIPSRYRRVYGGDPLPGPRRRSGCRRAGPSAPPTAPSGVEAAAGGLDVAEVLVGPAAHAVDRGSQGLARLGEGVLDPRRHGGVHHPLDQAVALQHAQVLGEHLVADTLDLVAQLTEAQGVVSESFDDQERPLVGDVREDLSRQRVRALQVRVFGRARELLGHHQVPQSLKSAFLPEHSPIVPE